MDRTLVAAFLLLILPAAASGQRPDRPDALAGVTSFNLDTNILLGENLVGVVSSSGTIAEELQPRFELALRREGIQVDTTGSAVLAFTLNCVADQSGQTVACEAGIDRFEWVDVRGQERLAITYTKSIVFSTGLGRFQASLLRAFALQVTVFTNDYLTANPKKTNPPAHR